MKKLKSIIAILLLIALVLSIERISATADSELISSGSEIISASIVSDSVGDSNSLMIDEVVFPHDEVVDVNIEFDDGIYDDMIANAINEEYVLADITYNGYTFYNIAIRPKGNSSLKQVVQSGDNRVSFKVDFNKYVDGQNFFGITKLNFNNIYSDPSLMAEYLGYEMLDDIGAIASDTSYISLSINGEFFGLYLAVEEVDENFLQDAYGNSDGELYKPDMGIGSDLSYISDDPDDYSGITTQDDNMKTDENFVELVMTIDKIVANDGETEEYNLSNILNVDSFLSYLAFSTATIHLDTYQSGMNHNYYLYFNTDTEMFEWISWDLNMIFNGFPMSNLTDEEATTFLIDEPVIGEMSKYPLVQAIFTNEDYVESYHKYLEELITNYLASDNFEEEVVSAYTMIESYARIDPSAFYTFSEVKESIYNDDKDATELSLLDFVELRVENISKQLNRETLSTNDGLGNSGSGTGKGTGKGMGKGMDKGNRPMNQDSGNETKEGMVPQDGMDIPEGMVPPDGMDIPEGMMPPDGMDIPEGMMPPDGMDIPDRIGLQGDNGEALTAANIVEIEDIASIIVSLAVAGGFALYLGLRKH